MNIEQAILEKIRQLPPAQQQEVLDFSTFLQQKNSLPTPDVNLTPKQKSANWLKWVKSHSSNNSPLPDEALHRDTIYNDEQSILRSPIPTE
jgi:hypothetical protein